VIVTNPGLEEKISLWQSIITFELLAQTWHAKLRQWKVGHSLAAKQLHIHMPSRQGRPEL